METSIMMTMKTRKHNYEQINQQGIYDIPTWKFMGRIFISVARSDCRPSQLPQMM